MATGVLAPLLTPEFFANSGAFLAGGFLYSYQGGTNTPTPVYVDYTLTTPFTNPVTLNFRGEPQTTTGTSAGIYIQPNTSYHFVLTDPLGNQIWTRDNVVISQLISLSGGVDTGSSSLYILTIASPFSNYTAWAGTPIFWIAANNSAQGASINVNGIGVVGLYNGNGTPISTNQILAGYIQEIVYQSNIAGSGNSGFVLFPGTSLTGVATGTFGTETAIASAATADLGSALAHVVQITGTTTITSFGSSASLLAPIYSVRFTGALTLTYNASTMLLPGNASIVTTAGDWALVQYLGAGAWKVLSYQYSTGSANTKIKPADTATTTSTTLTPDPDLQSNTLGIGRYAFEIYLDFDCVTAADGFKWTNDGTAVDARGLMPALVSGFVNGASYGPKAETPYGATITYATVSNTANSNQVLYKGSLLVGTAGTFGVSWAKNANGASAAGTLRAGSYLTTTLLNTGTAATGLTHTFSSGSGTEVVPSGYNTLTIEVWGGSGGGGVSFGSGINESGGGGGGSGGYSRTVLSVTGLAGDTAPYAVGAGGAAGSPGTSSTVGGGALPMTLMTAAGGVQGTNATASNAPGSGGAGGAASGGTAVNTTGGSGSAGQTAGAGGSGGPGGADPSGIYGAPSTGGGLGGGIAGAAHAGGNGLIIFTYSV